MVERCSNQTLLYELEQRAVVCCRGGGFKFGSKLPQQEPLHNSGFSTFLLNRLRSTSGHKLKIAEAVRWHPARTVFFTAAPLRELSRWRLAASIGARPAGAARIRARGCLRSRASVRPRRRSSGTKISCGARGGQVARVIVHMSEASAGSRR